MRQFVDRDAPSLHDKTSRKIREAAGCFLRGKTPRYFAVGISLIINVFTHVQHLWRISTEAVPSSHRFLSYESGRIQEPAAVWKSVNLIPYDLKIPSRLSTRQTSAIFILVSLSRFQWMYDHTFSLYTIFLEIPSRLTFCPVIAYPTHWSLNVSFTLQLFVAWAIGALKVSNPLQTSVWTIQKRKLPSVRKLPSIDSFISPGRSVIFLQLISRTVS